MSAVDDYLRALERERAADPRAFAMKAKMMAPAAAAVAGAGYTGPRGAKPAASTAPAVPAAVAARNKTVTPPSFAQVPAGQVAPARYIPPAPVTSPFGITYDGPMAPPSPYEIDLAAISDAMAGTQWDRSGPTGGIGPGDMEGLRVLATNLANKNAATIGPGNMEGLRVASKLTGDLPNTEEGRKTLKARVDAYNAALDQGVSQDALDQFLSVVGTDDWNNMIAGGEGTPTTTTPATTTTETTTTTPTTTTTTTPVTTPVTTPTDGRIPTPTTGFTDTQKNIINNALQDRLGVITTMVDEGLLDIASAQNIWETERNEIFANFLNEQQQVKRIYDEQQAQRQAQAAQLRADLFADVDQSLAAEDFAMANAILQGAGAENQDYLAAIGRIGSMSDDALRMMGGTVMRDADGNLILDEAGRPQFGGGIFGGYAQDLLSQERDMGAGAQLDAIDELKLADETALQGLQLAEFLGVDPQTFAAGQYAGVDVGGMQAARDAAEAAAAEAALDRALRRELSEADITSREGMAAADIASRELIAGEKDLLSRDLAALDDAIAWQKLNQDAAQYREQTLDQRELDRQKMELATQELALDQAAQTAAEKLATDELAWDQAYGMARLGAEGGGLQKGYLANAISNLAMNPDFDQAEVVQLIEQIRDKMDSYGQSALTNENIQFALAELGRGDILTALLAQDLGTEEEAIADAAAAETTTTTTTEPTAETTTEPTLTPPEVIDINQYMDMEITPNVKTRAKDYDKGWDETTLRSKAGKGAYAGMTADEIIAESQWLTFQIANNIENRQRYEAGEYEPSQYGR